MISKPVLRELINLRLRDAEALLEKRRYHSSIYMAGYAIEIALKYKICKMYFFTKGFPETKAEFELYYPSEGSKKNLRQAIKKIQEIRHHDLSKLLFYSGTEVKIKLSLLNEWNLIVNWSPEMRYKINVVKKAEASTKLNAVKSILKGIL